MPRPRPPQPLIARSIKLTAKQWARLDALGGAKGLRDYLAKHQKSKDQRNAAIKAELDAGVPAKVLAAKYRLCFKTIYNIKSCLKQTSIAGTKPTLPTSAPTQIGKYQSKWIA